MKNRYLKPNGFLVLLLLICFGSRLSAQTTVSTNFTNNNGSSAVSFNFVNNNAFAVIITDLASITGASGANTGQLWYKPGAIAGPPGQITVANGWTMAHSQAFTGVLNTTTNVTQPMLSGMSLTIPAGSTYGLVYTCTNLRYSTITAGPFTFSNGGCDITTGGNMGYGGTLTAMTNTPRGFLGSVTFVAATPCSGMPTPGNTLSSANPVCPSANFTLSLQNAMGTGIIYQWQSSPNNVSYTNIPTATNASYTASITSTTYYQCVVTCTNSGQTATSTPIQVVVAYSAACYCQTIPAFTADEEIFNVTIGTLNNNSTCASVAPGPGSLAMRYGNYTSGPSAPAAVSLTQGIPYSFNVGVNTCGTFNYNSGLAIFIDYNIDGDFLDPNEKVYTNGALADITCIPATNVTGSITVPVASTPGTTVMRIIDVEGTAGDNITPCLAYNYGETEDYLVTIVAAPPIDIAVTGFARPLTTGCYTTADTVSVTVSNQGSAVHNFSTNPMTINAAVTGPNAMSFTPVVVNTGTLPVAASLTVVITTTYNMSGAGAYGFSATATTTGDLNTGNNTSGPSNFTFSAGSAVAVGSGRVCTGGPSNVGIVGLSPSNASVQWQSSTNNVTWTNIIGQTSPMCTAPALDTTFYRAVICGVISSTSDTVFTISVAPATATHDTICGFGTATLTAAGNGPLDWYDAQTGGTLVDTGLTINPFVNATDTFWVENTFRDCGTGTPVTPTCYPAFTNACTSNDYIESFSTTNGSTNISNLFTGCNGAFPQNTTFFAAQAVSTTPGGTFNFTAQAGAAFGQGFRMWIDYNNDGDFADAGEDVWNSGFSSTAAFTGSVTVPVNTAPGPKRMRLMCRYATVPATADHCASSLSFGEVEEYTVNVCTLCGSTRVPAIVTITTAPVINASTSSATYCSGDTVLISVASSNGQYQYTWSPSIGLNTTSGDSVLAANPLGSYTYYVNAQDASGCQNVDSVIFSVNQSPSVIASANPTLVCGGDTSLINTVVNTVAYAVDAPNTQNTTTTFPAPYGNWYWGSHHQILILASEMTAAGITPGPITGLSWDVLQLNATPLQGFAIRMAHTTQTSLTGFQTAGFQFVTPTATYTPSSGVNIHTFSAPFVWNGVDNIIIETCFNNTSFTGNCVFAQVTTSYTATQYYFQDASGVCSAPTPNGSSNDRPATTLYAQSTSLGYAWSPTLGLNSASASDPIAMPPMSTTYSVIVTDPATGCTANDTVSINTLPTPNPNLGSDTAICSNTTLVLDAGNGNYSYMWQDSSVSQTFSVNSFGNYIVTVTDVASGCDARDTILVGINAAPSFTLGSDATVCQGTQVSFAGPSGGYSYLWNTLDSSLSITTGTAGSYNLEVTDLSNGCSSMDTVQLSVNPAPPAALGNDTSACSANGPLTLSAPASGYQYLWNTLDSSLSIAVNSTGMYSVMVTDPATSCFSNDTVMVTFNASPVASLGNDTSFCSASGPLNLVAPAGPYSYLWNTLDSSMFISAGATGSYSVNVMDTLTGCTTADSINLTVNLSPSFTLADTSFCGTQFTLAGPSGPYAYNWSTLDSTSSILVSASGTYSLTVTDVASGCTGTDVSTINLNSNPSVTASGSDLTPCEDDANVLLTGAPSGGIFTGPAVAGGQFDPSIGGGTYQVVYTFTDINGCAGTDTLSIVVDECVGIDEQFAGSNMTIYPNPNAGQFTFYAADMSCEKMIIEIVSVEGQVIMSTQYSNVQGNFTQEIDLNDFANGVYIMRVVTDGTVYTNRVIKQD